MGFDWAFVLGFDLAVAIIGTMATAQRPTSDWPQVTLAVIVAVTPWVIFVAFGSQHEGVILWSCWSATTSILLFATSTPIAGDFAPLLLSVMVGAVGAITSTRSGILAAVSACVLIVSAAASHRLNFPTLYVLAVGIGWLVGYLMRMQQRLILEQRQIQVEMSALLAIDERRHIAREVHDVIAHSLSVTLLHLTGSRHILEHAGDHPEVVAALRQAEHVGRQAMEDIRRTVSLLDAGAQPRRPGPAFGDVGELVDDFRRAGLHVHLTVRGDSGLISAATGTVLYRIAQESLSNVAKHAPGSTCDVTVIIDSPVVSVCVTNSLTADNPPPSSGYVRSGRGIAGMRQRIETLGGTLDVDRGPTAWRVRARVPIATGGDAAGPWRDGLP